MIEISQYSRFKCESNNIYKSTERCVPILNRPILTNILCVCIIHGVKKKCIFIPDTNAILYVCMISIHLERHLNITT